MKIDIYFGNKIYGCRFWDVAPRVGEYFAIDGPKSGTYEIVEIIWAGDDKPQVLMTLKDEPEI